MEGQTADQLSLNASEVRMEVSEAEEHTEDEGNTGGSQQKKNWHDKKEEWRERFRQDRMRNHGRPSIFACPFSVFSDKNKQVHYLPEFVGIGPYHFHNQSVISSLPHKDAAASYLSENDFNSMVKVFEDSDERIRGYYDRVIEDFSKQALARMMAKDACFVSEWLYVMFSGSQQHQHSVQDISSASTSASFTVNCNSMFVSNVVKDIIKLPCQIPLFLVREAFQRGHHHKFEGRAQCYNEFDRMIRAFCDLVMPLKVRCTEFPGEHLLATLADQVKGSESVSFKPCSLTRPMRAVRPREINISMAKPEEGRPKRGEIPSAAELSKAGIRFTECHGGIVSIKYNSRSNSIELPPLVMDDVSETVLHNLMAYEFCSLQNEDKCVTRFCHLMRQLMRSKEDVAVLRRAGLLDNKLGDDHEVLCIWKSVTDSVRVPFVKKIETMEAETWRAYDDRKVTKWWSEYKDIYWSRPWVAVSVIAAGLLLFMTFLQVFALFCPSCLVIRR